MGTGPERARDRAPGPFDEGLPQEGRTGQAPMDPTLGAGVVIPGARATSQGNPVACKGPRITSSMPYPDASRCEQVAQTHAHVPVTMLANLVIAGCFCAPMTFILAALYARGRCFFVIQFSGDSQQRVGDDRTIGAGAVTATSHDALPSLY
jgi:hypothetical protein